MEHDDERSAPLWGHFNFKNPRYPQDTGVTDNRYDLEYSYRRVEAFTAMRFLFVDIWIVTACRIYGPQ
jgi:hypothetical protein